MLGFARDSSTILDLEFSFKDMIASRASVSIVIPTWNRREDLRRTLHKLRSMDFPESQIHVYVNGCSDGTLDMLHQDFSEVKVHRSSQNDGLSWARNVMIQDCSTEFVIGFDSDSWPLDADFARRVIEAFERWPQAAFLTGCVHDEHYPSGPPGSVENEFAVKRFAGGAWATRRERFLKLGGFRPYFMYGHEELEIALRAHARGWLTVYVPSFRVYHANAPSSRDLYANHRNGLCNAFSLSFLNEPAGVCAVHLAVLTGKGWMFCFRQGHANALWGAWKDFLKRLPRLLRDRRPVRYAQWRAWWRTPNCPPE